MAKESFEASKNFKALKFSVSDDKARQVFGLFDRDGDGKISMNELGEVMKSLGADASQAELKAMIGGSVEGMFTARGGAIDFATFKKIIDGEKFGDEITDLQEAFKLLDKESKGFIGAKELLKVCKKLGEDLTEEEANAMVGEALIGYEGKIYYDGLLKILITQ